MSYSPSITAIAKICHEVNLAYCRSLGDNSQVSWEEAQDWQKISAVNGVKFKLDNLDSSPEDSHNSWLQEKEATGWKYGLVKDVDKKEHPCFVPYDKLPQEQKAKDYIFQQVVKSLSELKL